MEPHPIRVVVRDDLERSRLTVFFRLLLALPHIVWLVLWSIAAVLVAILSWFIVLFTARLPDGLHGFMSAYLRYGTHVYAFVLLAANPFPGFTGTAGSYPLDLEIAPPARQSRWKTAFRIILVVPALLVTGVLVGGGGGSGGGASSGGEEAYYFTGPSGVAITVAFLAWFACLVRGRMPNGFRDFLAYALRYSAQTYGYLFFLTDRYPHAEPTDPPPTPPPPRTITAVPEDDDLRRSRLTVFFRLLLALPHIVWLVLWGIAVHIVLIVAWFAALILGRLPDWFHRFVGAFLRYEIHVFAYVSLVANPFPGFVGEPRSYPFDLRIDPSERQSRWTILFRFFLAFPALLVESGLALALWVSAFLGWFASLVTGRMPSGLRGLGAYALGYYGQTYGYLYLLTDRYPYSGPPGRELPAPAVEEEPAPEWPDPPVLPSFSS